MRIESIRTIVLTDGLPNLLVEIVDEAGNVGTGECWWGMPTPDEPARGARPIAAAVEDLIAPRYLGQSADHIQRLWFETADRYARYGDGIVMMALSGVDMALWDLKAQRLGCSLVDLLGGPAKMKVRAYASLPPLRDFDALRTETQRALDYGFHAIKLHELDPEATAVVREAGGDDLTIMVDVNGHFDVNEAIDVGNALDAYDILWFEEPVRPMRDVNAIAAVAERVPMRIAAGENEYSLADFERLMSAGIIDYVQPEITKFGGITPALRISTLAELHHVALCPHNFRLGPCLLASIHWGFTSPATEWFELPWVPEGTHFGSTAKLPAVVDGFVDVPDCTGIGYAPHGT